jgi:hypothetical protein
MDVVVDSSGYEYDRLKSVQSLHRVSYTLSSPAVIQVTTTL